ncbi:MAG: glutathione S-transferase N-terminal domain-containing protein [Azonexus sp.]|jgi:glutathione S-transferase|uniref:glutathione S-transferase N-terminal domain-containing protein n=1 Tax=Azonexus sp. TaxID=1872668 RepID=UPI0028396A09|nr:glutathione S-transferase N-terminal domain-containing protein [Azonexus sp.]MDR0777523.1 glutathione S-transferase N-terminal domain-containing protein [Azonexus sp.]
MKLIGSPASPYTRKARIVLAEKKIEYDFVIDSPLSPDSAVPALNPLGKIPVLVLDDETPLFDSRVIADYIDNVSPNNKLIPAPNRERSEVKRWEAVADGICDAVVLTLFELRRPQAKQDAEWIAYQQEKITRGLAFMATELGEQPYCMGTHFSMADIAVGVAFGYLSFRLPSLAWRENHPNLDKLHAKLLQRPSFADTLPSD